MGNETPGNVETSDPLPPRTPCTDGEQNQLDLRIGRRMRVTGGTYAGDVGTVVERRDGHYRIKLEDSIHPIFNVKRRPFSLWLGSWWLAGYKKQRTALESRRVARYQLSTSEAVSSCSRDVAWGRSHRQLDVVHSMNRVQDPKPIRRWIVTVSI